MSKKSSKQKRSAARGRRRRLGKGVIAALALALVATAAAVTRLPGLRHLSPFTAAPAPQSQPNLQLSKEYVYAGGRLVATEEPAPSATPAPTPAGPAPANLVATGTFPTPTTAAVNLSWLAPSGSVSSYVVERAEGRDAEGRLQYAAIGPPVTIPPTPPSPYVDPTAEPGKVYLYRVKAVFDTGGSSGYSKQDLATTVRYTGDDPLVGRDDAQGRAASPVRASVLTELRGVVDSIRTLAGVPSAAWRDEPPADPRPAPGVLIRAWHFEELRTHLNRALSELDISEVPADTTLAVGQPIKARHIQDVRDKVR